MATLALTNTGARGERTETFTAFALALTDIEALRRARAYLETEEIATSERVFQRAVGSHREMLAIGTGSRSLVERIRELVEWPVVASPDWSRGFLAAHL